MIRRLMMAHAVPALLALVLFLTVLPFIESAMRIHERSQEAVVWHGVEVVTERVRPGGLLEMVYTATINKQCPSDIRGFFIAPDNTVPVRLPTVAGGYARPSSDPVEIRVKLRVPEQSDPGLAPLVSGQYIYRTIITRYCPDGVEDDNHVPDARFQLEVP